MRVIFLFSLGVGALAIASTSQQPEIYMWLIGAVSLLSGASLMVLEVGKEDIN